MGNTFNYFAIKMTIVHALLFILTGTQSYTKVYQIGASRQFTAPSKVSALVNDGDTIEIDAGLYKGDVCSWYKNNLVFRGVGGFAQLSANGNAAEQKAIWVIKGQNCVVENIEFSDCKVADYNGAGIRAEGDNLYISHCYFHHNEDGLLSGANSNSTIIIEFSEFADNGHGDGYSHNMYIGKIKKFVLRFCYIHNAIVGHNVKSRAMENLIAYNLIMDSTLGNASYQIDLPNGGESHILGNSIMKGKNAENPCFISYGMEGIAATVSANLFVYNNTLVNERASAKVLQFNDNKVSAIVMNNIFVNMPYFCDKFCDTISNIFIDKIEQCNFKDNKAFDFHLNSNSPGIDMGTNLSTKLPEGSYIPLEFEYKHPNDSTARNIENNIDIGAYEFYSTVSVPLNNEANDLEFNIFPNPVTSETKVLIKTNYTAITIDLTDVNGNSVSGEKIIEINNLNTNEIIFNLYEKFNLKQLAKGVYFLNIKVGNTLKVAKLVI